MRPSLRKEPWVPPVYEYMGEAAYIRTDVAAERIHQAYLDGLKEGRGEVSKTMARISTYLEAAE